MKYDVFEEGLAENAAQFTKSKRAIIEYVRRSGDKESDLLAQAIEEEITPVVTAPPRPPQIQDPDDEDGLNMIDEETEIEIWREEVKMIAKRRQNLREGLKRIYALLLEQCSPSVQGRLK